MLHMIELDCIKHCAAWCCKPLKDKRVIYDFSSEEAQMLVDDGGTVTLEPGGGYTMPKPCVKLRGKFCVLHGKESQPACCGDNKVGEDLCLFVRGAVLGKRWNVVE